MTKQGLKVNKTKTNVIVSSEEKVTAKVVDCNNVELEQAHNFKYFGVTLSEDGGSEEAVRARINAAWLMWKIFASVIYDERMPKKRKVKMHETVIRPVLLCGAELWTLRNKEKRMLATTEMKMLRRIKGITLLDRQRRDDIRT